MRITPILLPIREEKTDDPLHYVRLKWRRFSGSLRLWRPAWTWKDDPPSEPTPSTIIYLARSERTEAETYEPTGTELILAFSKIENADDALAFADRFGFLGTEEQTAAVSLGLTPINELAPKFFGILSTAYFSPESSDAEISRYQRANSGLLLLELSDTFKYPNEEIWIHSSFRDLEGHLSVGEANSLFRELRKMWLQCRTRRFGPWRVSVRGLAFEPVRLWLEEASALKKLLELWRAIEEKDETALARMISPDGQHVTGTSNYGPPLNDFAGNVKGLKSRAKTDLFEAAKEYLAHALNFHLHPSISTTYVCVDSDGSWRLHSRPMNLRAALWMQFSEIVAGTRKMRPCNICLELMDVTDKTRRKKVHDCCSQRECMRRYRKNTQRR